MEFRLVYKGPLASNGRAQQKHNVRKALHPQLIHQWKDHPHLRNFLVPAQFQDPARPLFQIIADKYSRGGHRFLPLARWKEDTYVSLDILFLRRGSPGAVVQGGDLDNRLKTLLDGLKVPSTTDGLPQAPENGYDPIFCLMEDDCQITSLNVTADRLLIPLEPDEPESHVLLIIHINIYVGTNVTQIVGLPGNL